MAFLKTSPYTTGTVWRFTASPPVLISFTDATTGARKVSTRSNHSWRQRIVNFTGSLDSPLEGVDSNLWFRNARHAAQDRPL